MEQKNRGTYKVNMNITPKENVVALLKITFPMDTTLAKMQGTLDGTNDDMPYYRRGVASLKLNNVTAYPASSGRWNDCTEIKDFHKVVFSTKTSRKHTYNRSMMRSVPVVKGKISLTKVTRLLTQFAEFHKEYEKEQEEVRIEQERREELRKVNEKRLVDLKNALNLPKCASVGYAGCREEDNKKFNIEIQGLKEEQVVAIAQAIKEALKKVKEAKGIGEIVEGAE